VAVDDGAPRAFLARGKRAAVAVLAQKSRALPPRFADLC
jgi:hypothetical protein